MSPPARKIIFPVLQLALALCLSVMLVGWLSSVPAHSQEITSQTSGGLSRKVKLLLMEDRIECHIAETLVAEYVFDDPVIKRPYFTRVRTLDGRQVTRNHPPQSGVDRTDHETMHPGIWLAFGDVSGADFWRNQASVRHVGFDQRPTMDEKSGSFVEHKQYVRADGSEICQEKFRWEIHPRHDGYLMVWDSTFISPVEFTFGDQEEMGLGMRIASPLAEVSGGRLTDAESRHGAKEIWSQSSQWCDYSGTVKDCSLGLTLLCHPDNFGPSWMHARDYGLLVANPFGRKAMKKGDVSQLVVQPGESLRLRYGIWCHACEELDPSRVDEVYSDYLGAAK